jgi:23S rRNA pseudouridine1911/1915/1917 synthase
MSQTFIVSENDYKNHKRLDTFLSEKLPDISRSLIRKHFENGLFTSNQELNIKRLSPVGTEIYFQTPEVQDTDIMPQNIPLEVLFEDDHLIIINKQAGIVVHPAPGNPDGTLVNAILYHCPNLSGIGNEKRPGIVHRLDKGTSGIMVIAKSQKCHEGLVKLFSTHDIERKYEAIILGTRIEPSGKLESLIGRSHTNRLKMSTKVKQGKQALTNFKIIKFFNKFSHVELKLETGRTHQIRVHLSELKNCPIVNDPLYGRLKEDLLRFNSAMKNLIKDYEHPFLHAKILGFIHPITKEKLYFEQEPPQIFKKFLDALESDYSGT